MHYSLLDEPVITVRYQNGKTEATNLPSILRGLLDNSIVSFEALQPHQQQAWYSFIVQLAAMAVARENGGDIPTQTDVWRKLLVNLAGGSEAAWHLVVDDVSQPAFMQPPVPEGSLEEANYSSDIKTPDELDMLVTSKNHDLKGSRILRPDPEHWLYALLTLQTMEGYSGKFNYGISRMNGGGGNRPFVGITPNLSWCARFSRDLNVLLEYRNNLFDMYDRNGHTLLWISYWNGQREDSIPLSNCDPFFIEICRRVRFQVVENAFKCMRTTTKSNRIDTPDDLNGITKDPWTPIKKDDVKALSVLESGFTYPLLQQILLGEEIEKPVALNFQEKENNGGYMINQALVRGGGVKTETNGLHKRIIKISPKVSGIFFNDISLKNKLSKRSSERVALASKCQKSILFPAISELIKSGTEQQIDFKKLAQKIDPWTNRFDQEIDQRFFESLWASVEMEPEVAKQKWEEILLEEAETIFKEAQRSTPISQLRRLRALSKANSVFYGQANKIFEYAGKKTSLINQTEEAK